uniref:CSON005030 protein n=1 Tax=Culicoides sonorensis TaxID=179676 RepID=A0A336MW48_CULSO
MVDRLVNSEANARRIQTVENCFGSSGEPLSIPGRVLVGEGVLTKMCRKRAKPRQFFLFNDILVYGNIVIGKKKYNKQHIIPLEEVQLQALEDNTQFKNGWVIRTATKSFAVYAATNSEKQEWMAHINKCVEDLLRKSGKKPNNNEATVCMRCKKSQFTVINRRHHCRNCGAVCCGPCSNKKWLIPSMSTKPVRVCLDCYDKLSQKKTVTDGPNANNKLNHQLSSSGEDSEDEEQNKSGTLHDEAKFYGDADKSTNDENK